MEQEAENVGAKDEADVGTVVGRGRGEDGGFGGEEEPVGEGAEEK